MLRSEDDKGISLRQLAEVAGRRQRARRGLGTSSCAIAGSIACWASDRPATPSVLPRRVRAPAVAAQRRRIRRSEAIEVCLATLTELGFDLAGDSNIRTDLEDRPQKSPRACVIASDPPDRRPPHHEGAGRACPTTGASSTRRATRCTTPAATRSCRTRSAPCRATTRSPRSTAFLIESLSREPGWHEHHFDLSPEAGGRERRGDDLPPRVPLPPLHREAPVRARLLVAVPRGRGHVGGLRRPADRGDGLRLPRGRVRRGHGRGLLLGRLPARVDPLGPGALVPDRPRWARTGGATRRRAISCASCSGKARSRRARRLPAGSASTRSTSDRSWSELKGETESLSAAL